MLPFSLLARKKTAVAARWPIRTASQDRIIHSIAKQACRRDETFLLILLKPPLILRSGIPMNARTGCIRGTPA
jgi:hypothetical protein